ncbi:hypothetical protein C943_03961 [Mariniradius saccharolyticus AK6]|uniref:Uncharacterized protein n=1 Tax=Mariniradius saccharolyticus AK6 TaxID=1239962 RepID=M7XH26_9BACT|nr:hypothetical protein C943_03961 [Mariniradius saccharolyticus AK6]
MENWMSELANYWLLVSELLVIELFVLETWYIVLRTWYLFRKS